MKNIVFIIFIFSGIMVFSQKVSGDRKIKSENISIISAKEPAIKNETVHTPITNNKGPVNAPEIVDTNTVGTVSDKKNTGNITTSPK